MTRLKHAVTHITGKLASDLSGAFAVWAALFAPVLISAAALSVDAARMYNLDQELQSAADALARAGAAELDQRSDSITRSDRAIANLVSNNQKFGKNGSGEVTAQTIRYLIDVPDNDFEEISESLVTTDPKMARFVEVTVVPEDISMMFPRRVVQSITSSTLHSKSIAGTEEGVCSVAPLFVCNPYEDMGISIYDALETPSYQRRLIQFKAPNNVSDTYGPGNFGFLDPFDGQGGAGAIADAIAVDMPTVCFSKASGVDLRTGNIASLRVAFNTRFDLYEGSYKSKKNDSSYAPAANVVKGYSGSNCNQTEDPNAMALPQDDCFATDSCPYLSGRMGNGNWNFVDYMEVNHNAPSVVTIEGTTYTFDYVNDTVSPTSIPSRYQVYRWEIDTDSIPGALTYGTSSTPEEGIPQCHNSGASTSSVDRRIVYAAVINCTEVEAEYGMNGSVNNLPVETFVKVFVTQPIEKGQDNIIWGEISGAVIEGEDAVARARVSVTR